ncbi:MAG: hypothetical protein AB1591_02520 [Pseudomonadota bacterium]
MNAKFLIPLLLAASTVAQAGTLAANSAGTSDGTFDSADCAMVQTAFVLKLSQNVGAAWTCSTTAAAVNTGSTKGTNSFGGSTAGGTIAKCSTPVNTSNGYGLTPAAATDGCS